MGVVHHDLKPISDPQAMESIKVLSSKGALSVNWYTHRGYRICCSLEPSRSDGGYEWHVSVSFAGMAVDWETAEKYGRLLCPQVGDVIRCRKPTAHLIGDAIYHVDGVSGDPMFSIGLDLSDREDGDGAPVRGCYGP